MIIKDYVAIQNQEFFFGSGKERLYLTSWSVCWSVFQSVCQSNCQKIVQKLYLTRFIVRKLTKQNILHEAV